MIKRITKQSFLLHNPHFWVLFLMTVALAVLYCAWPWRGYAPWLSNFALFELRYDMVGSLFMIPLTYAILTFWWRGALIIWSLSFVAMLMRMAQLSDDFGFWLRNMSLLLLILSLILITSLVLKWRHNERKTRAERELERQVYMSQVFKCQEDERQQIAQEIHDGSIQTLLAVANRAQTLVHADHNNKVRQVRQNAKWVRDTILNVSEDLRRLSLHLRPSVLDTMGLVSALIWQVDHFNEGSDTHAQISISDAERKLPPEIATAVFRIVQEALSNVRRHSKATVATITLKFPPQSIELTVQDDGVGFSLPTIGSLASRGKFGLIGMEQRTKSLNGTFRIHSQPDKGTLLKIKFRC